MTKPDGGSQQPLEWTISVQPEAITDLKWFDAATRKLILSVAAERLTADPTQETRNLKTLRANRVAQRELRLQGRYRVLFDVNEESRTVVINVVGEKRGNELFVRGQEYRRHHETDLSE